MAQEAEPRPGPGSDRAEARRGPGSDRGRLALLAILLLAALLRFPLLDVNPNGLWCDEASTGYDAYSLLETGRDQHGERLPLFARSFGDWNEALYRYLAVPFVAALGLDELSTRLPAAVVGLLTVWLLYGVARELHGPRVALAAALLLAISPWHVQLSRMAFRAITLPALFLLALWVFLAARRRPALLPAAGLAFGLALWTYSSARVFVPAFGLALVALHARQLRDHLRPALAGGAVFTAALAFLATFWLSPEGMARARETVVAGPVEALGNYLAYLDPRFLFWSGDPSELYSPLHVGQLHLVEALTVPAGLAWVALGRDRHRGLYAAWLLLYPVPAFLTESPQAVRAILGAPLFALLSGAGLVALVDLAGARRRALAVGLAAVALLASTARYAKRYFVDYPVESATQWDYGLREAYRLAERLDPPCAVVSDRFFLPYIYILFYTRFPPATYQQHPVEGVRQGFWYATDFSIGRYHVKRIRTLEMTGGRCLFMLRPGEAAVLAANGHAVAPLHQVLTPDGHPVIELVDARPLAPTAPAPAQEPAP